MGTVYEALNVETTEPAAIKLLSATLTGVEDFRERFAAEIATLKKLNHPNIVRLFGFGEQQGRLYYAMELVDGPSLEGQLLGRKLFEWREVARIGIQVCAALRHAHDRGVVHRDIKPANLLVDCDGSVKLSDFGIARLFGKSRLTNAGSVMGAAEYMAPEQAEGGATGPASDLYSLGAVMYALLARRPVFQGRSLVEVLQKQRYEKPTPLRQDAPEVPIEFEQIVDRLLEKAPERRVRTAMILSKQLTSMLRALPAKDADADEAAVSEDGPAEPQVSVVPPSGPLPLPSTRIVPESERAESAPGSDVTPPQPLPGGELPATLVTAAFDREHDALEQDAATTVEEHAEGLQNSAGGSDHFTPVAEEELDRAEADEQTPALISLHTWVLAAALVGVAGGVWYLLQPPTADALYERIMSTTADGSIDSLSSAEGDIEEFLHRFSNEPRADRIREMQEDLELHQLERRLELRSRGFSGARQLLPIERAYLDAIRAALFDTDEGIAKLQALLDLYGPPEKASGRQAQCLQLAARRLAHLQQQVEEQAGAHLAMIEQRLAKAEQLRAERPGRARAMYRAIIELYDERPWAASAVDEAHRALEEMPTP